MLKDKFFWASYGKFFAAAVLATAASVVSGVPLEFSAKIAVGSLLTFPLIYRIGQADALKRGNGDQPSGPKPA